MTLRPLLLQQRPGGIQTPAVERTAIEPETSGLQCLPRAGVVAQTAYCATRR
jgi:hypothetical protein